MTSTDRPIPELWQLDGPQLAASCAAELTTARAALARAGRFLVEIDARGSKDLLGYATAATWLAERAGLTPSEAREMLTRAKALHPGRNLNGTPEPALAPLTGAAALEGALSRVNIDLITATLPKIPTAHREFAEATLVELARVAGPRQVKQAIEDLLARLDPDGPEPKDPDPPRPQAELHLKERKDGWWDLRGRVDPLTGRRLRGSLDPLAKHRPAGEDELPDLRSPQQRDGDAFAELIALLQSVPEMPTADRAQLLVTVSLDDLQHNLTDACLDFTTTLSATDARMLACDCAIIPVVLGGDGEALDVGRAKRLITPAQRKALALRDGGCAFPGCDRKVKYTEGHHIIAWDHGGLTDLHNLCLLCAYHHRLVHKAGWTVRIAPDGITEFLPPATIDPHRKPRRNNLHQLPTHPG